MGDEQREDPTLEQRLLDTFLFAPAGFILATLDDLPRYAALGRDRLGSRVSTAKTIGEFAVTMGKSEMQRRTQSLLHRTDDKVSTGEPARESTPSAKQPARPPTRHARPEANAVRPARTPVQPTPTSPGPGSTGGSPDTATVPTEDREPPSTAGHHEASTPPATVPEIAVMPSTPATNGTELGSRGNTENHVLSGKSDSAPGTDTPSASSVTTATKPVTTGTVASTTSSLSVEALAIHGFDTLSASQVVQRLDGLTRVELIAVRSYEAETRGRRTILSRVDQLLDERS